MKFAKLFQRIYSLLRLIKTHPLAKNEKLSALIRYFTFHLRYKDGEEIAIPFSGGHLIISKGEGSQAHYFTHLEDYEEMAFLLHFLYRLFIAKSYPPGQLACFSFLFYSSSGLVQTLVYIKAPY